MIESINWTPIDAGPPDAEFTHMVTLEDDGEPTWFGWWDGEVWRDACTGAPFACAVTAYADMPEGYKKQ